ncbi:MAG: hypothetical protein JWQ38_341 [Flavipsychrobacter sp.]|nr:hypothetical protein [Flavipsychrobacter sp.]
MIIKCVSRKSNVGQLIRYVLRDDKIAAPKQSKWPTHVAGIKLTKADLHHLAAEKEDTSILAELKAFKGSFKEFIGSLISKDASSVNKPELESIIIKNNIRSRSIPGYIKEFERNESFRLHARSNNVLAHHHVISFNKLDSPNITGKMLKDIAQKYMSLKESSLFLGAVHHDKDHVHIHLIQSGVQYCTGIANREPKEKFLRTIDTMQRYQLEMYPQLSHSRVSEHAKSSNEKASEKNIKTLERCVDKNALLGLLEAIHSKASSTEHFLDMVTKAGHEVYYRNGKLQGIKYEGERKFRFSTLGYKEKLQELGKSKADQERALQEIQELRNGRVQETHRRKEVEAIIQESTVEIGHLQELQDMRQAQGRDRSDDSGREETDASKEVDSRDHVEDAEVETDITDGGMEDRLDFDDGENVQPFD